MKFFLSILLVIVFIVLIVTLHLGIAYVLPFPWNKINIIFAAIIIALVWFQSGLTVWVTAAVYLFIEVYTPVPFGVNLLASTVSILGVYWLSKEFVTNTSWYSVFGMTAIGLFVYRVLYTLLLAIIYAIEGIHTLPLGELSVLYVWEMGLTTVFSIVVYTGLQFIGGKRKKESKTLLWKNISQQ
ncbi:MAG: hypothetical protein KBD15_01040 [Candidatus Magasanikbacteria bacterium]|nr:hypothetical protein [Candidatus Magasanikbacteria bacterium]